MWGASAAVSGGCRCVEHGWNSNNSAAWMHACCGSEYSRVLPRAVDRALQSGGSASSCACTKCWLCRSTKADRNFFALLSSAARPRAAFTYTQQRYLAVGCACEETLRVSESALCMPPTALEQVARPAG